MATETQSVQMLKLYDAKYILVFTTLALGQAQTGEYYASWAGYGDEGKWTWMARISGKSANKGNWTEWDWNDETPFGEFNSTTSQWQWNERGMNTTIYKLMSWGKNRWCSANGVIDPDEANVTMPQYFEEEYFAGLSLSQQQAIERYGGLIPLVCLYKVNYPD